MPLYVKTSAHALSEDLKQREENKKRGFAGDISNDCAKNLFLH